MALFNESIPMRVVEWTCHWLNLIKKEYHISAWQVAGGTHCPTLILVSSQTQRPYPKNKYDNIKICSYSRCVVTCFLLYFKMTELNMLLKPVWFKRKSSYHLKLFIFHLKYETELQIHEISVPNSLNNTLRLECGVFWPLSLTT